MELTEGIHEARDLAPGAWFYTRWCPVTADEAAQFAALTGIGWAADDPAPPLLILSLIEGAKQSGSVQIAAELLRGWRIVTEAPVRPGIRVRGRYEVITLRRGLLRLALRIETDGGITVLTGEARLILR